ncbi:ankyrin repeat-containing domain protein [Echria macrotheca]|uniref:Ankyrin repeat-containing domain protein n=1 Tax=Echria macrotheca TaxID=438768 RepID=A0AAJ0B0Z9_9PEZI|nr:ankyrin repeat-containing domain protein [Echria macrotheca]
MAQKPADLWEQHRGRLEELYIDRDLTVQEVAEEMKKQGFAKSKSSYEKKFREWKVVKNTDWRGGMGVRVANRARNGKQSSVYDILRGTEVSSRKILRASRRYAPTTSAQAEKCTGAQDCSGGNTHETDSPWNMVVYSPEAPQSSLAIGLDGLGDDGHNLSPSAQFFSHLRCLPGSGGGIEDSESPTAAAMILVQLHLLSNDQAFRTGMNDQQLHVFDTAVVRLLGSLGSAGIRLFKSLLSEQSAVAESIKDRALNSIVRLARLDMLRVILDLGVDVNANLQSADWEKQTPIQFAAGMANKTRSSEMVRMLINHGANVDGPPSCPPERSPLCLSIRQSNLLVVDALLDAGAAVSPHALKLAIQSSLRHQEKAERESTFEESALEAPNHGSEDKENGCTPKRSLSEKKRHEDHELIPQRLMKAGARIDGRVHTTVPFSAEVSLLGQAILSSEHWLAEHLLSLGADPNALQLTECFRLLPRHTGDSDVVCTERVSTDALGLAVAKGDPTMIKLLLVDGWAEVNLLPAAKYCCPLLIACVRHNLFAAQMLLGSGANVPSADANALKMGCRPMPLLRAIEDCDSHEGVPMKDFQRELIRLGARDVSIRQRGPTPFSQHQDQDGAEQLVCRGSVSYGAFDWRRPDLVTRAILEGNPTRAVELINQGYPVTHPDTPTFSPAPLDAAITVGDTMTVQILVECRAAYTRRTLGLACAAKDGEQMIKLLIPYAVPTSLRRAGNNSDTVYASPEYTAETLAKVVEHGRRPLFQLLLPAINWHPDCLGQTLAKTILLGSHLLVQDLLDAGASLNTGLILSGYETGQKQVLSAWDAAIASRQIWIVKAFVNAGADVNLRSLQTGKVPLEVAAGMGDADLTIFLLQAGAEANAREPHRDHTGAGTALQTAAILNHVVVARELIRHGAGINAKAASWRGRTALEGAAEHGHLDMLHLLLRSGASFQDDDRRQFIRAVRLAQSEGHNAAVNMLKGWGGWTTFDEQTTRD